MTHFLFRKDDILSSFRDLAKSFVRWTKLKDDILPSLLTHSGFVRWTKRKTTFSLQHEQFAVLSGGQNKRRHSPFTLAFEKFCPVDNRFSGFGGLQ